MFVLVGRHNRNPALPGQDGARLTQTCERYAASLRSTYCRIPPFMKYSTSLAVSIRQSAVKVNFEPSLRDHFEHTAPIADAPSLVPHEQPPMLDAMPEPLQPLDNEDIESFAARRTRKSQRDPRKKRSRLPSIVLALVALNAGVVIYRAEIVRVLPQTASLFSAIGLPVNLRGMTFEEVTVSKETNDGVPVLVVTGKIVSAANKPVEIPRMRFAVRDTAGQEIYSWTAQPDRSVLGAARRRQLALRQGP